MQSHIVSCLAASTRVQVGFYEQQGTLSPVTRQWSQLEPGTL